MKIKIKTVGNNYGTIGWLSKQNIEVHYNSRGWNDCFPEPYIKLKINGSDRCIFTHNEGINYELMGQFSEMTREFNNYTESCSNKIIEICEKFLASEIKLRDEDDCSEFDITFAPKER